MSDLQAILQQGAPQLPDRPEDIAAPTSTPEEAVTTEAPDTRKLSIVDKGMDGEEIKMTVESSKDGDPRINFLLRSFTEKTDDGEQPAETPEEEQPAEAPMMEPVVPQQ